jgi:ATP-dependent protease ClpP protease subunit
MEKPFDISTNNSAFIDRPLSKVHKFYISGEIKPPSEYVGWFETIRNAGESDVVVLHINSYGGDLFTAIQFMRAIAETKANIVASVEGACMSAATIIFLCAKNWEISKHSMFMFHNYSSGSFGKGGEMYDNIVHEREWSQKLWKDVYSGFLTETEITSILHNKDIWMSGEEVTKRLQEKFKPKKSSKKSPKKKVVSR